MNHVGAVRLRFWCDLCDTRAVETAATPAGGNTGFEQLTAMGGRAGHRHFQKWQISLSGLNLGGVVGLSILGSVRKVHSALLAPLAGWRTVAELGPSW